MKTEEILYIMDRFADREIGNLTLHTEGVSLSLNRTPYANAVSAGIAGGSVQPESGALGNGTAAGNCAEPEEVAAEEKCTASEAISTERTHAEAGEDPAEEACQDGGEAEEDVYLTAPVAGVFYHAPAPGKEPYVSVGQTIHKGETVGLLEAMKMISEVPAECDGVVEEILMENEAFAAYHAPLLRIRPLEVAADV
jgi:acetyl-CoA carboxylase biotin carboxyl carrier protein